MQRVVINGIATEYLSVMDRSIHYGDGVFETISYRDGVLQFWDEHITRMQQGAGVLGIPFPGGEKYLEDVRALLTEEHNQDHVIKLLLTRGVGDRGYKKPGIVKPARIVTTAMRHQYPPEYAENGISVCICAHPLSSNIALSGIKHLNRLDNVIARNEWNDEYQEGLMLDAAGNVIEGTMSNLFGARDNVLYTPEIDTCGIKGVIRQQVISIAGEENVEVKIQYLSIDDIYSMDEVFVTNSVIGLWPVAEINNRRFTPGKLTRLFESRLLQRMEAGAKVFF